MKYLLDSNVFIQAKNEYYGMDFCPGFWDWLIAGNEAGIVASVARVHKELRDGETNSPSGVVSALTSFFSRQMAR